ncbi:cytoplasmic protein [Solimonas sp. K1W22B-7]|nr:cytoplasmic protein [Solimonas sp. K1W22B-7]
MGVPSEETLRLAHKHSIHHRHELLASSSCGCFYCLSIYSTDQIEDWTDYPEDTPEDRENEFGMTALCPHCGVDSVIGAGSGYPITAEFLQWMKRLWFAGSERRSE